jgi:integrase
VFVKRDLRHPEWRRLEAAAFAVSKLPLRFADAHGANAVQLEDAFCRSITETRVEHQLVVIDHLDAPLKPILPHLEQLSEVVRVPVFVLLDVDGPFGRPLSVYETGARLRAFGVDGYISRRRSEGAADTTISKELVVLRKSLRLAIRAGLWRGRVDEVIPVAFSPGYEPRERALTAEELKKLLTELLPDRAACVAFIVATSACWRETELARRADVGEGLATVLLRGTKRKTRFRTVPIVSPAQQSLLAYALEHALMARAMGLAPPHPGPFPRLVPGERGGRLRVRRRA